MTVYADLHRLTEDQRVALIAGQAREKLVGVALEKDEPAKIARYIKKVTAHAGVRHVGTYPGLTAATVLVQFGPKVMQ